MESGEEFNVDFSTFQYNPMFNYLNVQTMMSLGINYEVNNGLILVNPDPLKSNGRNAFIQYYFINGRIDP